VCSGKALGQFEHRDSHAAKLGPSINGLCDVTELPRDGFEQVSEINTRKSALATCQFTDAALTVYL
jgi:hypothetical protein